MDEGRVRIGDGRGGRWTGLGTGHKSEENRMGEFHQGLPPRRMITHFLDESGRGKRVGVGGVGVRRESEAEG